jgi:hypothetical protein
MIYCSQEKVVFVVVFKFPAIDIVISVLTITLEKVRMQSQIKIETIFKFILNFIIYIIKFIN